MKRPCVYLLASGRNGTLYLGVTSDLYKRLREHQRKVNPKAFTAIYNVDTLVWFEEFDTMGEAIQREKTMKKYSRRWKTNLIEERNPRWLALDPNTGDIAH